MMVAGIDLGGTAINFTFLTDNRFLIEGLHEYPSKVKEGPDVCLTQIEEGIRAAAASVGLRFTDIDAIGLDTPGPASARGVLSARGSTNFAHTDWAAFDLRGALERRLHKPVAYLNDGNAGALWGHAAHFGAAAGTSVTAIIGTGLGGGIVIDGRAIEGRNGFGGELGHVFIPCERIPGLHGLTPLCNCGRAGDLEALCSLSAIERTLLPLFLTKYPNHELSHAQDVAHAARLVRGLAEDGDAMCRGIFRVQAGALALFFDIMTNTFDPDAFIVGGGALETSETFRQWFLDQIRDAMPEQRAEQATIPIIAMPNGDTASARGAAIHAMRVFHASPERVS